MNSGIESGGNAAIPATVRHPELQVTARFCPTVKLPLESRYMKAVPLPPVMVADVELVNENVTLPSRKLQGVAAVQAVPIANVVGELLVAAKSASWLAVPEPDPPLPALLSSVHVFAAAQP